MTSLQMPKARQFGWTLKHPDSSLFATVKRKNGQFCCVLNHALVRGVNVDMLAWWFRNFTKLQVRLPDTPNYEGEVVPAYLLWHPVDHFGATLSGELGPGDTAQPGASIHIREAMQYERYGWKYPVDTKLRIFYVEKDGWSMGRTLPIFGPVMMLRISFVNVSSESGEHLGVHYHYEVVIGATGNHALARAINRRITASFGPEFFSAWHRHNVIEVGTFENFLPALYPQRHNTGPLEYRLEMNPAASGEEAQQAHSLELFKQRVAGYREAARPFDYQAFNQAAVLLPS